MKPSIWLLMPFAFGFGSISPAKPPPETLPDVGVTRGICVVLGDPKCELAIKLAKKTELLVYVQLPEAGEAERARLRMCADCRVIDMMKTESAVKAWDLTE